MSGYCKLDSHSEKNQETQETTAEQILQVARSFHPPTIPHPEALIPNAE